MDIKYQTAILVTVVTITLVLIYHLFEKEDFATKQDKAKAIYNWFSTNSNPNYGNYKNDLAGASNIVEYEDVLKLYQNRNLTLDSVSGAI